MKFFKIFLVAVAMLCSGMMACKKDNCDDVRGEVVNVQNVYEKDYMRKEIGEPAPLKKYKRVTIRYGNNLYTIRVSGNSSVQVGSAFHLCIAKEGDE